jgi:hypothetical protein
MGVGIEARPVLGRVQQDFDQAAVIEPAGARRVGNAGVLKTYQLVLATVGEPAPIGPARPLIFKCTLATFATFATNGGSGVPCGAS